MNYKVKILKHNTIEGLETIINDFLNGINLIDIKYEAETSSIQSNISYSAMIIYYLFEEENEFKEGDFIGYLGQEVQENSKIEVNKKKKNIFKKGR